ncbi:MULTISPECIES: cytochrome-c oxidase [unclassified Bacillus (in: firmicutes)]|uniref:cytochrome-c oxidase n=1 Tax=unclassified Bacillus (in: firmicutes) TaxID=185979 RepID=UPI0008E24D74|nr:MULTISPECIES: cytochrome-c oxidase [unclassified Bacillus (in: firmicutes)]SFA86947.1 Cytochrome C and Quinol oxidase polypeptide I [Bacillus sp. UNCCL13]SFQ83972.1 Cytochrome C and Quinol oxidase polypeptide I [Bacillus sp. cl95]
MGVKFIKISVVYFVVGVCLGMYMSMNEVFTFTPVHVHINLLGWTAMTLFGLIYVVFPKAAETTLAKVHFWIHNICLPIMMVGLALLVSGNENGHIPVAVGSTVLIIGIILFAINVLKNVKAGEESKQAG